VFCVLVSELSEWYAAGHAAAGRVAALLPGLRLFGIDVTRDYLRIPAVNSFSTCKSLLLIL